MHDVSYNINLTLLIISNIADTNMPDIVNSNTTSDQQILMTIPIFKTLVYTLKKLYSQILSIESTERCMVTNFLKDDFLFDSIG